jgi:hypothetical protein
MSTFRQIVNKVITITNRPDLLAEIELAVRQAVLSYHHLDTFWRDQLTGIISVSTGASAKHNIDISRFEGLRAIASVRPYYSHNDSCGKPLEKLSRLGARQTDYWFLQGNQLVIKSSTPSHQFQFSYWKNPTIAPEAAFSSWVADLYPDAVEDSACAKVFEMMRDSNEADRYRNRVGKRADGAGPATGHCHRILTEQLEIEQRSY